MAFKSFKIDSLAFFESIILPAFADVIPVGFPFKGTLNEFTIMDDVPSKRTIVDIRRVQNILQRRDASCDIIYKKIMGASTRQVSTDEVYGATEFCRNEFYQGSLKDWRNNDPLFADKILPFFQGALNTDICSNSYFGDTERVSAVNAQWSTNIYDGAFKWYKKYIAAGVIPAAQSLTIANGTDFKATPSLAFDLIKSMYDKRPALMAAFDPSEQKYTVTREIAEAYEDYLISVGLQTQGYTLLENGIKQLSYKNIAIKAEPTWSPIIAEIKGSAGHAAILTLRGNEVFATDKDYGEGEDGKTALEVFYSKEKMQFIYRLFLKAGTQVALPEHTVIALSSWT